MADEAILPTKEASVQSGLTAKQKILIVILIIIGVYVIWYFSPEARCRREARMKVYENAAVADISEIPNAYRTILQDMIKEETRKCLEGRE